MRTRAVGPRFWTLERDAVPGHVNFDAEQFARLVLSPARPQRARALAAVEGLTEPREAWEVLATRELIPVDAATDGADRVFVDLRDLPAIVVEVTPLRRRFDRGHRYRVRVTDDPPRAPPPVPRDRSPWEFSALRARTRWAARDEIAFDTNAPYDLRDLVSNLPPEEATSREPQPLALGQRVFVPAPQRARRYPPTVTACALFAVDYPNVLRAEALARESVARLSPAHAPAPPTTIAWYLAPAACDALLEHELSSRLGNAEPGVQVRKSVAAAAARVRDALRARWGPSAALLASAVATDVKRWLSWNRRLSARRQPVRLAVRCVASRVRGRPRPEGRGRRRRALKPCQLRAGRASLRM